MSDSNSFAVFGGSDFSQVVGGRGGLRPFRNNPDIFSHIKAWALSGKGIFYGTQQLGQSGSFPAVIDTGSTIIAVPTELFSQLLQKWQESDKNIDCKSDGGICQSVDSCENLAPKLAPVGFLIAGGDQDGGETVFEVSPKSFLFQAQDKCQFAIIENKLD